MLKNVRMLTEGGTVAGIVSVPMTVHAQKVPMLIWSRRYWRRNDKTGEYIEITPYIVAPGFDNVDGVRVGETYQPSAGFFDK